MKRIVMLLGFIGAMFGSFVIGGEVVNYTAFDPNATLTAQQLNDNFKAVYDEVNANYQLIAAKQAGIGDGQTWQNLTPQRAGGTLYQNDTGRPIMVNIAMQKTATSGPNLIATLKVGATLTPDVPVGYAGVSNSATEGGTISAVIPNSNYYQLELSSGTLVYWSELR